MTEPIATKNLDQTGSAALPWSRARDLLATQTPTQNLTFFVGTVRPDGRPHAAGVGAVWVDDALYFKSGPGTLILSGTLPRLQLVELEAQLKSAEAALAVAQAEQDRGVVRAPWSAVVHDVAVEVGQAAFSMAGREIASLVALDPMLAVVEVAERQLAGIKVDAVAEVRLVTGERANGKIRFVAKTASPTTRTYRVEVELPNADGKIPDGITAEVVVPLAPVLATRVPRSAVTFSSAGDLGLRVVDANDVVEFTPVGVIEDEQSYMWVTGLPDRTRVIVQGQDFVREGQTVDAVGVPELTAVAK